jgi:hypothetical protein
MARAVCNKANEIKPSLELLPHSQWFVPLQAASNSLSSLMKQMSSFQCWSCWLSPISSLFPFEQSVMARGFCNKANELKPSLVLLFEQSVMVQALRIQVTW